MSTTVKRFIPFAVIITCLCGLVYGVVQQTYRQGANDPQIQIATDFSDALMLNGYPSPTPPPVTNIKNSLSPFAIVYDANGKEVFSTGNLQGKTPQLPQGVLDAARKKGKNAVTWQPESGVRIAAYVVSYKGTTPQTTKNAGFVLVGRNLREVEAREQMLSANVLIAWVVTMLVTFVSLFLFPTHRRE